MPHCLWACRNLCYLKLLEQWQPVRSKNLPFHYKVGRFHSSKTTQLRIYSKQENLLLITKHTINTYGESNNWQYLCQCSLIPKPQQTTAIISPQQSKSRSPEGVQTADQTVVINQACSSYKLIYHDDTSSCQSINSDSTKQVLLAEATNIQ